MKKIISVLLVTMMFLLSSCGTNSKTLKTKEEIKTAAEQFYADLYEADQVKMSIYNDGTLYSVYTKDGDKMHQEIVDETYGYDYYMFAENGVYYTITDTRDLFEDEYTYLASLETIKNTLDMTIMGYFNAEDDAMTYSATLSDSELVINISGESEGSKFTVTNTGKKENGKVTSVTNQIKYSDTTYTSEYKFEYGVTVELPEYTAPKTYNDLPHVDSPFKTYGEIIDRLGEDEYLFRVIMENELFVIDSYEGRNYQFSSVLDDATIAAYDAIDVFDEDYEQKLNNLLSDIEIEDCIDFTDALISQTELDSYIGKTVLDAVNDGFEVSGFAGSDQEYNVDLSKDGMRYTAHCTMPADFELPEDYDYDVFNVGTIDSFSFTEPEYSVLPLR